MKDKKVITNRGEIPSWWIQRNCRIFIVVLMVSGLVMAWSATTAWSAAKDQAIEQDVRDEGEGGGAAASDPTAPA